MKLPVYADVARAGERLAGVAVRTPLLQNATLDALTGGRILLKPECLQRVGAFKLRGAYNRIADVDREAFPGGVVACSSGNHAQGVAAAAALLGHRAAVVMPADAPALKIERTRSLGAEVVLYDREREDRDAIARAIGAERRADFIHPFDDAGVIAGQGTVGLEIVADVRALGAALDAVLVPCSGGGLASGIALAAKHDDPRIEVHTVEPHGFDDFARSLAAGERLANARVSGSIADALMAPSPGRIAFAIGSALFGPGLVVTDAEMRAAMRFAFAELKLVLEPGGAAALAALLTGRYDARGRTVAVVLSGGNVDDASFGAVIAGA